MDSVYVFSEAFWSFGATGRPGVPAPTDRARIASARFPPRAVGAFRKIGWALAPCPANDRFTDLEPLADRANVAANLASPGVVLKEWVGLVVYYALGRTGEVFPGPDKTDHAE